MNPRRLPRHRIRSWQSHPASTRDANGGSVSGMSRVEIGCARNVPGIGWIGVRQALQVNDS